jgi:hypothetical protein
VSLSELIDIIFSELFWQFLPPAEGALVEESRSD